MAKFGHGPGSIAKVLGRCLCHLAHECLCKAVQRFRRGLVLHHRQAPQRVGQVLHAEPGAKEQNTGV